MERNEVIKGRRVRFVGASGPAPLSLLRVDGITFTGNKHLQFERLDQIESEFLHADGESVTKEGESSRRVAVVISPKHGAIGSFQVKTAISSASQRGYDDLVFAGFAFDAASQDKIHEENEDPASKLFPDKSAWEKLRKALSGSIDPEAFAAFSGTKSLPFHPGEHKKVAIKVIDPRGNEVMRVHSL